MADEEPANITGLFAGLVPDDVIGAYVKLLGFGGVVKEHAAEFLGADRLVEELAARGMAHVLPHTPSTRATFQPASPELALLGVLADFQPRMSDQQKLLFDGHRRLADARSRPAQIVDGVPEHLVRVITDRDEILRVSMHLINSAHRDWMTLESQETDMPITDDYPIDCPATLRQRVRIRSIYDVAFTEHPVALRFIERSIESGEQARILPAVPMKMQLADETAVAASPHANQRRWSAPHQKAHRSRMPCEPSSRCSGRERHPSVRLRLRELRSMARSGGSWNSWRRASQTGLSL